MTIFRKEKRLIEVWGKIYLLAPVAQLDRATHS